ncbi:helix-turn-helix domain-containing protein [Chromobacterium subtsugae]|uniref:helix-turn-helix domain-containing protein n=1 Tax=Chromobacterium subtsugae TaxID=251747 RepID=UPI0009BAB247|nr:helix-turn-helix transcriptional regulator [Chromobacterium subtsugae]
MVSIHAPHDTTTVVIYQLEKLFDCQQPKLYLADMGKPLDEMNQGERITHARESVRLSQKDFAQALGLSQQAISKLESGDTRNPQAATMLKISRLTGQSLEWLIEGGSPSGDTPTLPTNPDLLRLFSSLQTASLSASLNAEAIRGLTLLVQNLQPTPPTDVQAETGTQDAIAAALRDKFSTP